MGVSADGVHYRELGRVLSKADGGDMDGDRLHMEVAPLQQGRQVLHEFLRVAGAAADDLLRRVGRPGPLDAASECLRVQAG